MITEREFRDTMQLMRGEKLECKRNRLTFFFEGVVFWHNENTVEFTSNETRDYQIYKIAASVCEGADFYDGKICSTYGLITFMQMLGGAYNRRQVEALCQEIV